MVDETVWKRRFATFALLRLSGLAIFFLGVAIAFSDIIQPGGWPALGGLLAIAGLLEGLVMPRIAKRAWDREDAGEGRP
ncbi:hypothetical protein G7078_03375 [Sphingomonas sinipercae]|uniref:Uncharacterized protein n=1 Tax=Sphingomonas sinipercae TaxID=2714944 RepID=A0A6G7ZLR8_9SPHN|nr:hypothetical protein [Sphingomonas sinipercae]QIL01924.1 hypothetical protein G7078_03375 [Sphingomonas sinipercae]